MKDFLRPFVRKGTKEEPESIIEYSENFLNKLEDKGYKSFQSTTDDKFQQTILDNKHAQLVYFTTL